MAITKQVSEHTAVGKTRVGTLVNNAYNYTTVWYGIANIGKYHSFVRTLTSQPIMGWRSGGAACQRLNQVRDPLLQSTVTVFALGYEIVCVCVCA